MWFMIHETLDFICRLCFGLWKFGNTVWFCVTKLESTTFRREFKGVLMNHDMFWNQDKKLGFLLRKENLRFFFADMEISMSER